MEIFARSLWPLVSLILLISAAPSVKGNSVYTKEMSLNFDKDTKIEFILKPWNSISLTQLKKRERQGLELFEIKKTQKEFSIYVGDWGESDGRFPPFKKKSAEPEYVRIVSLGDKVTNEASATRYLESAAEDFYCTGFCALKRFVGIRSPKPRDLSVEIKPIGYGLMSATAFYGFTGGKSFHQVLIYGKGSFLLKDPEWIEIESFRIKYMEFLQIANDLVQSGDAFIGTHTSARFHEHAAELLKSCKLSDKFNLEETLQFAPQIESIATQNYQSFDFSDLPLTIARGESCFIDLYFWRRRPTTIHNHHFSGAFMDLLGKNVDLEFSFTHQNTLDRFMSLENSNS
jgi:hypothetical protein